MLQKRERSVQEPVCHIIPQLWLRKVFTAALFANTNLAENRYRDCVSEKEIKELPKSSTDIFKANMLDWYKDKWSSKLILTGAEQYSVVNETWYAEFLRIYYLKRHLVSNDNQPVELTDIDIDLSSANYPKVIPLTSNKDKLQCYKVLFVLRYDVPINEKHPENIVIIYSISCTHLRINCKLKENILELTKKK